MNDKGYTLLEVVLAIAIFGIAVVPLVLNLSQGYIHIRMGDDYNKAAFYLQQRAEEIISTKETNPGTNSNYMGSGYNLKEEESIVEQAGDNILKRIKLSITKKSRNLGEYEFLVYIRADSESDEETEE